MKKSIYLIPALATMLFCSCEDFLDRDMINKVDAGKYFVDEKSLLNYANGFLVKYTSAATTLTYGDQNAEYVARTNLSSYYLDSYNATNQTGWGISDWNMLYNINYFLSHMREVSGVSEATLDHYEGVGRFWRAWFYWAKVKTFGGVTALAGVQFQLKKGEIHALMGENGAGKSTFIKVITGVHQPDSGIMLLEGERITPRNTMDSAKLGIAAIYQHVTAFPDLSVTENIFMGQEIKNKLGMYDWRQMNQKAKELIEPLSKEIDVTKPMGSLSVAAQQLVEIAKALSRDARILIMDEPTAHIDEQTENKILENILSSDENTIMVTHRERVKEKFDNRIYVR